MTDAELYICDLLTELNIHCIVDGEEGKSAITQ